jgi:hypothetical protein
VTIIRKVEEKAVLAVVSQPTCLPRRCKSREEQRSSKGYMRPISSKLMAYVKGDTSIYLARKNKSRRHG